MTVPTVSWDETSPAGNTDLNLGDNRIREMKTQIREVIAADHKMGSSGQDADNGKHNQISLLEQADLGTGAEGKPILGAQTVGGKAELVFTDEDDNDIQLTDNGKINAESIDGVYPASAVAKIVNILQLVYPVGSVVTLGVSTNPGTLFGVGTWTAITGKVIVGLDSGDTDFDALNETGGAKTVTTSNHTHSVPATSGVWGTAGPTDGHLGIASPGGASACTATPNVSSSGSESLSIVQPYIVKYVWERTA